MKTYIFNIHLLRDQHIQRKIEVPESWSLYKLASAIVDAFNFNFDHAFGFFNKIAQHCFDAEKKYELFADMKNEGMEPTGAASVEKTKIAEVWKKIDDKMLFLFDYGDNWLFVVELVGFKTRKPKIKYPRLVTKKGKAPEQYPKGAIYT